MGVRLVVADDRRLVAEALASALRVRGHRVLGASSPAGRAAELVFHRQPDVCLLGTDQPAGEPVLAAVRRITGATPRVGVVILGPVPNPGGVAAVFAAGARGYVRDGGRIDGVEAAMHKARAGDVAIAPQLLRDTFTALLSPANEPAAEAARLAAELTDREADVLRRIVEGQNTQEIASGLGVTTSTARTHVQRLLAKLDAASRLEAVALAVRTGLLDQLADGPRRSADRLPRPPNRHPPPGTRPRPPAPDMPR